MISILLALQRFNLLMNALVQNFTLVHNVLKYISAYDVFHFGEVSSQNNV